jgi:signal peptidase
MKTESLRYTVIVCVAVVILQSVFLVIPSEAISLFNSVFRPSVYAVLAIMVYVFMGKNARPVRKAFEANMVALASVAAFGVVMLIVAFMFGAGRNVMTANPLVAARTLWERGMIVLLGNLTAYKLIKGSDQKDRAGVVVALTAAFAYGQMNTLHMLFDGKVFLWAVFYATVFRTLVIGAMASVFAVRGSLASVVLPSFVYTMTPFLAPFLPNISPIALALIISGSALVSTVVCYFVTSDNREVVKAREKQASKYVKRSVLGYAVNALLIIAVLGFFMRVFPFYPVVVLSGSMSGTFERGSLLFIEKAPPGKVFESVGEGAVIHFINRNRVEYVHRVVDFRYDVRGEREYVTKGDASLLTDSAPVPQNDVLGIARASLPYIGYPYILFQAIVRTFK